MALDKDMIIPEHVALILDGNGRWAKKRGLPRTMGHKEGCVTVEKTVELAAKMGIRYLTVYGFQFFFVKFREADCMLLQERDMTAQTYACHSHTVPVAFDKKSDK